MSSPSAERVGSTMSRSWRWLLPCVLAPPMLLAAQLTGRHALLFPEVLALAFGVWVLRRPEMTVSRWRIAVLPTACATIGIVANRLPWPRAVVAVCVLSAVLALLQLTRCRVAPALSAAVLPVVFDVRGLEYLITVAVLCSVVALTAPRPAAAQATSIEAWKLSRVAIFGVIGAAWIAASDLAALPPIAIAPPLLVAALEYVLAGPGRGTSWVRRCLLLTGAGAVGAGCLRWVPLEWLAGTVAALVVALLAIALTLPLAPALAVALVPFVAGISDPLTAVAGIALGATVLHLAAWVALAGVPRLGPGKRRRAVHHPA